METATKTIRQLLAETENPWLQEPDRFNPEPFFTDACIEAIVDRFDDCPEALQDFGHSDWVNLAECYTRDLLARWERDSDSLNRWVDQYLDLAGIDIHEALADSTDPDSFTTSYVNLAMSYAAGELCRVLYPDW